MVAESVCRGQVIHSYKSIAPTYDVYEEWHCATVLLSRACEYINREQSYSQSVLLFWHLVLKAQRTTSSPRLLYQQGTTTSLAYRFVFSPFSILCVYKFQALLMHYRGKQGHMNFQMEKVNFVLKLINDSRDSVFQLPQFYSITVY